MWKVVGKMEWNKVQYVNGSLEGNVLPPDGKWVEWKDSYGNIELARIKYDIIDHFFPSANLIQEENVVAWRYKSE